MGSIEESNTQLKQCTICLEYGQKRLDPRMLPCGHAYCLNCLKEHKKVNKELKCPGCRNVLKSDINIDSLPCDDCPGQFCEPCLNKQIKTAADILCVTCEKLYCKGHKRLHEELHNNHEIIPIETSGQNRRSSNSSSKTCPLHPKKPLTLGCKICKLVICTTCLDNLKVPCKKGSFHHMASLDKLETGARKSIDKYATMLGTKMYDLNSVMNMCTKAIAKMDKNIANRNDLIKAKRDEQIEAISQKYEELSAQLVRNSEVVVDSIANFIDTMLVPQRSEIEKMYAELQTTLKESHQVGAIEVEKDIEAKVRAIVDKPIPDLHLPCILDVKQRRMTLRETELETYDAHKAPISVENIMGFANRAKTFSGDKLPTTPPKEPEERVAAVAPPVESKAPPVESNAPRVKPEAPPSEPRFKEAPSVTPSKPCHKAASTCNKPSECSVPLPVPNISESSSQSQIASCFVSHLTVSGSSFIVVDSLTPVVHKVDKNGAVERFLPIDQSLTVIGIAANESVVYVQFMDVADYARKIHVYSVDNGGLIKKWDTPGVFGASMSLVDDDLVICSKDMLAVYSAAAEHIRDIPLQQNSVVRKLCTWNDEAVIVSTYELNQVSKYCIETGNVLWTNCEIQKPASVSCCKLGRVFVLVKPTDICVLNGLTGCMMSKVSLPVNQGMIEDITISNDGKLVTASAHKCTEVSFGYYTLVHTYELN